MMEKIIVSQNQRVLVTESGAPFFWLADTAWELFTAWTAPKPNTTWKPAPDWVLVLDNLMEEFDEPGKGIDS